MSEIILSLLLLITIILSYLERRELVNKLMARDLTDYKANTEKPEVNQRPIEDDTIPLEDAQELLEEDMNE